VKRALPFLIVGVVALLTVAAGAFMYRAYKPQELQSSEKSESGDRAHVRGPAKALVTIEEYGDFQCPPCGLLSEPLNQIERDFQKRVRLVFRNLPLATHVHAKAAAYAAEAAGLQGKCWEMHDLLYREQAAWSKAATPDELFLGYAKTIGLNVPRFQKDVAGDAVKARVEEDQKRASGLGVSVTPTIFLNGKSLPNTSLDPTALRAAVQAALVEGPAQD